MGCYNVGKESALFRADGHEAFACRLGEIVDFAQDGGWVVAQGGEVWEGVDVV